jgi:hypothetical protein
MLSFTQFTGGYEIVTVNGPVRVVLGDSCGFGLSGEAEFDDFAWLDFMDKAAGDDVAGAGLDRRAAAA